MDSRHTYQEKIASAISRRLNKRVAWCYNRDRSIDVFVPKLGVVVVVDKYTGITIRASYGRNPSPLDVATALARANDAASKVDR